MLLADWHRPAGPRGGGSKAVADTEAEVEIRSRLTKRFPQWRFKGEETGVAEGAPGDAHCWLVDPNDGTVPYLAGHRGSAVAIGLVRDGVPVLGVVFSFAYPDDRGDFLAWAEGCGPLLRNDRPVEGPSWPSVLSGSDVVLVSQAADRKPEGNLHLLRPARYRCVPSIAYRLALVAAGEGVATFSLSSPGDYDYGAAHALLRGAGGDLVDERGETVRYSREGVSKTSRCFGGAPKVIRDLARRNWSELVTAEPRRGAEFGLLRPVPGCNVGSADTLDRAQGCLLGLLAGDALGSQVEFERPEVIRRQYPNGLRTMQDGGTFNTLAGQPTDDGELALSLARALVAAGHYDPEDAALAYVTWLESNPFDCGVTTRRALGRVSTAHRVQREVHQRCMALADPNSQANGALMRIAPMALWGVGQPLDEVLAAAAQDAALTHPHAVCQEANRVFVAALMAGIRTGDPEAMRQAALAKADKLGEELSGGAPADYLTHEGWVRIALRNAFYQLATAKDVESGLVDTVMRGGDTDTNGAIAGALLGARFGRSGVPFQWSQMVLSCRPLDGVVHPRPQFLWPVDAPDLAERLLVLGGAVPAST
jgi:ADP-ribosylglycohydrolase/fructose-1,6-bisphosphatase/inositol monophosphatase family enzyme